MLSIYIYIYEPVLSELIHEIILTCVLLCFDRQLLLPHRH